MSDSKPRVAFLPVTSCNKCPHKSERNPYSTDGFDHMVDWHCKLANRKIRGSVEWHEENKIKIPDWCPLLPSDESDNNSEAGTSYENGVPKAPNKK